MAALVETMFSVREVPWHGLGTIVEEAPTSKEALELAGLNWEIKGQPVFDERGNIIPGYVANTRNTDNRVMGIVSRRYSVVQNAEAFAFTDALIGDGVTYETAGALRDGKQIWLLAKLPETKILDDTVIPYVCFTNTHDGTGAVRCCMTPVRVVCNNTLNLALTSAKRSWSTPHRGDIQGRLEEAKQTLELAQKYMVTLNEEADRLANESMTYSQMVGVLTKILPIEKDMTDRQKATVQKAREDIMVCTFAPDILKFAATKWGFVNAVADYVGHAPAIRNTKHFAENRWSNIIGGAALLDKATAAVI